MSSSPSESPATVLAGVKLVVWDLDETLWHGTLDEGDTPIPSDLADWIPALADAGIISSICSNNDPETASRALATLGLRSLLVSPRVGWEPKSTLIPQLLADLHLRSADVLFVDDCERLRDELLSVCGVRSVAPSQLRPVDPSLMPRTDPTRERLSHYLTLARRGDARATAPASGGLESFLWDSRIRVTITPIGVHAERVAELTRRANQRNLTGSRLTAAEVGMLAVDPKLTTGCVWLRDKFGEYGLVGFFAIDKVGSLARHLVFSCRSMNMGLEEWLVDRSGLLDAAIDSQLNRRWRGGVNWISVEGSASVEPVALPTKARDIVWIGGCDLQAIQPYIPTNLVARSTWQVIEMLGNVQQYGHSSLLVLELIARGDTALMDDIPWLAHWTRELGDPRATTVLSLWVDYACLTIRHRKSGIRLPTYMQLGPKSTPRDWEHWWGAAAGQEAFLADYEPAPALTPDEISGLLGVMLKRLAPRPVLLINAPDFPWDRTYAGGANQSARNREVNAAVDSVVLVHPSALLIDVRRIVTSAADLDSPEATMIFHYDRRASRSIAENISERLTGVLGATE
jgi:FkbH-like protein